MTADDLQRRRTFLKLAALTATQSSVALAAAPNHPAGNGGGHHIDDGLIRITVDPWMHCAIDCYIDGRPVQVSASSVTDYLELADGTRISDFRLISFEQTDIVGEHGPGRQFDMVGVASEQIQKVVVLRVFQRYPGFVLRKVGYINQSAQTLPVKAWVSAAATLRASASATGKVPTLWAFSGASYPDRRDWVQPLHDGFEQANFMGMNGSDYGGGTPIVDVWRRDCGVAIGHVETVPKLVSLPIRVRRGSASIGMRGEAADLAPGAALSTPAGFVAVHRSDYYATLATYRNVMADLGMRAATPPAASYQPIWCAWGYERDFSIALVEGTLDKARQLGLDWAVIDDGWQTANGDWYVDVKKFPRGVDDLKALAQRIKDAGLKPRLWFSPLAVGPGTDLLHDHTDMLLLDKDGAVQNITWWNSFYLCPAYEPTVSYTKKLIRTILGDWGFEGIKIDGQHLNGVAPCYNPAHHHARPEQSVEQLQDFYRAIYDTAMEVNPEAVIEICPCGTSFAFHNLPYMNQTPASDPLSSWQVRLKGKTIKALMGPQAPFAGDHVELSDGGNDFASSMGIGAVLSTKFTWPIDPKLKDSFLLTPAKEVMWRKWIGLYNEHRLPTGTYRGELYDIGFDKPEAHVVEKDGRMYYAFYSEHWDGPIELRGLKPGSYVVRDYVNDVNLGQISDDNRHLVVQFAKHLLLEVIPS